MNEKATAVVATAKALLGSPYVWGAWGKECTVKYRKACMGSSHISSGNANNIVRRCPVLNGSKETCEGCQYQGMMAFDCRGFVHYVFQQAGIEISGGGATSQYNTTANWLERGDIGNMPDLVCPVFMRKDGKCSHVGLHIGGGVIIHCSGEVKYGKVTDKGWTAYGIPATMYSDAELKAAGVVTLTADALPTLRKAASGAYVQMLQNKLLSLGYDELGAADGKFGNKTEGAVRAFQENNGLKVDGIVGQQTWKTLLRLTEDEPEKPAEQLCSLTLRGLSFHDVRAVVNIAGDNMEYTLRIDGMPERIADEIMKSYPFAEKGGVA